MALWVPPVRAVGAWTCAPLVTPVPSFSLRLALDALWPVVDVDLTGDLRLLAPFRFAFCDDKGWSERFVSEAHGVCHEQCKKQRLPTLSASSCLLAFRLASLARSFSVIGM